MVLCVKSNPARVLGLAIAVWISLLAMPCLALNPNRAITQYLAAQWQKEQGLPRNSVRAIVQTPDGYLWIGTSEGLARFNGLRFTVFDAGNTPELRDDNITALCVRRDGSLWIGTAGAGLVCYHNGRFQNDVRVVGLTNRNVQALFEDTAGRLWAGTGQGLWRNDDQGWKMFGQDDGWRPIATQAICQDRRGRIWLGTTDGVYAYEAGQFTRYTVTNGLAHNLSYSLCVDQDDALWIGTERGLCRMKDGQFRAFTTAHGMANSRALSLRLDLAGNLWIGTSWGLNRWNRATQTFEAGGDLLAFDTVQAFCEDCEGNLWIGTEYGLTRLTDGRFSVFTHPEGLKHTVVFTVYEDSQRTLWLGTWLGGLYRFSEGRFTAFSTVHGLSQNIVTALLQDRAGALWAGTRRGGLNRFQDGVFTNYLVKQGLADLQVLALHEDRAGVIWIGTGAGLSLFTNGALTRVKLPVGEAKPTIRFIGETRDESLWLATDRGLLRRQGEQWTRYSTKDGLPSDSTYDLFADREDQWWVGTAGGLAKWNGQRWTAFRHTDGLLSKDIFWINEDEQGHLWYSSSAGIFCIDKQELDRFAQGRRQRLSPIAFSKEDGLRITECRWLGSPAGCRGADGKLWFATARGLAVVDPAQLKINRRPPPVVIEQVLVNGRPVDPGTLATLKEDTDRIEFHFAALSLTAPEKNLYRYRLEGFDQDWVDAGKRTFAPYANLPAGQYRFQVIARNHDGIWNETGASIPFYLPPYFYETVWFYCLCGAGLVVLAFAAYGWRIHGLMRREKRLVVLVDERTRKLQQEVTERLNLETQLRHAQKMEAVGQLAAGVAHDFNNILTVIEGHAGLLLQDSPTPPAADALTQINASAKRAADLTRQLLAFSRKQLMQPCPLAVNEVILQMARMLQSLLGEQITLETRLASGLPAIFADATMLEQVIMNLAVNARDAMPKGGRLTISTSAREFGTTVMKKNPEARKGNFICLRVADTGCGMDAATLSRIFEPFFTTKAVGKGTGLGLATVYGIVKQHEGWIEARSQPGQGTTFDIFFPASTQAPQSIAPAVPPPAPAARNGRETILVVEDEAALRALVCSILAHHGYRILEAGSGAEALQTWKKHRQEIDLLLTDMIMPEGMTGKELAERLEADKASLKVILTTGYSVDLLNDPAHRNGYPCLQKPYPPDKLITLIRQVTAQG